ncbi:hypothetical protein AMECASPLE_002746 [Ameca splendens]|uniref:Uncharacterized protein n=1 Tax=Ameca splendens TaxID=208324 RepID=A0ABV0XYD8_9TELE
MKEVGVVTGVGNLKMAATHTHLHHLYTVVFTHKQISLHKRLCSSHTLKINLSCRQESIFFSSEVLLLPQLPPHHHPLVHPAITLLQLSVHRLLPSPQLSPAESAHHTENTWTQSVSWINRRHSEQLTPLSHLIPHPHPVRTLSNLARDQLHHPEGNTHSPPLVWSDISEDYRPYSTKPTSYFQRLEKKHKKSRSRNVCIHITVNIGQVQQRW